MHSESGSVQHHLTCLETSPVLLASKVIKHDEEVFLTSIFQRGTYLGGFSGKVQWYDLPVQLKSIDSEEIFEIKLREYLIEGYDRL